MPLTKLPEKDRIRVQHMLDYAHEAISHAAQVSKLDLAQNRLIHGFDAIDPDTLWQTVNRDRPDFISRLEPDFS